MWKYKYIEKNTCIIYRWKLEKKLKFKNLKTTLEKKNVDGGENAEI